MTRTPVGAGQTAASATGDIARHSTTARAWGRMDIRGCDDADRDSRDTIDHARRDAFAPLTVPIRKVTRRTLRIAPASRRATQAPVTGPAGTVRDARGIPAKNSMPARRPNADAHATTATGRAASSQTAPRRLVAAPARMSSGKIGTQTRFASGETSDTRPNAPATTGSGGAVAASVVASPWRVGAGTASGRSVLPACQRTSPAVARAEG